MPGKRLQESKSAVNSKMYVLFGFCRSNPDDTGFLAKIPEHEDDEGILTDKMIDAMRFAPDKIESARKYVNEEFIDIYKENAFAFHPVAVIS